MASRPRETIDGLLRNRAALALLCGAASSSIAGALLAGRWPILVVACLLALGFPLVREWKEAGLCRRELLVPLSALEAQGREYVARLAGGDGNAPALALNWSREASKWFRTERFGDCADILDLTIEPEYQNYATGPTHNRMPEVLRRAQSVVEKVLSEAQAVRERIEARIARR